MLFAYFCVLLFLYLLHECSFVSSDLARIKRIFAGEGGLFLMFKFGTAHLKSPAVDLLTPDFLADGASPTHNFWWCVSHYDFRRPSLSAVLLRSGAIHIAILPVLIQGHLC